MDAWQFLGPVYTTLTGAAIGGLAGWVASARKSRTRREKALAEGVLALLRAHIVDAYRHHVTEGRPLTVERRNEVDKAYEAYEALGGNGTIKHLYEELKGLPTLIVGERMEDS